MAVKARFGPEAPCMTKILVSAEGPGNGFVDKRRPWTRYERNGRTGMPESEVWLHVNVKARASPG